MSKATVGGKKKLTAWNKFTKHVYAEGRKKNKKYAYKDALRDASERKSEYNKKWKNQRGGKDEDEDEDEDDAEDEDDKQEGENPTPSEGQSTNDTKTNEPPLDL